MPIEQRAMPGFFSGLSFKLITTIILVILVVEVALYLPSVGTFRANWLDDRLRVGIVAARVLDAVPDIRALPPGLTDNLLMSAGATALVYRREGQSQLIALDGVPTPREAVLADMRDRNATTQIAGALDTLTSGGTRTVRIIGSGDDAGESLVEVLIPEAPLRAELLVYSRNVVLLSLIIAAITAIVLYLVVSSLFIRPIRRLTGNVVAFRQAPENGTLILGATARKDEMGVLENELGAMETDLFSMLHQRRHLADLGLAVAKINHDLRNTLTSAQLLSDQVVALEDPNVQRLAPRLVLTLNKAIGFAQSVLEYGRETIRVPRPGPVDLSLLLSESAADAGLIGHPEIAFSNAVPDNLVIKVDPEQMGRVFVNLLKNAREALEGDVNRTERASVSVASVIATDRLVILVSDDGPGLPPRAREHLFVAFEGSARSGGTGLGLAIARELVEAAGGDIALVDQPRGTRFEVTLPRGAVLD